MYEIVRHATPANRHPMMFDRSKIQLVSLTSKYDQIWMTALYSEDHSCQSYDTNTDVETNSKTKFHIPRKGK